MFRCTLCNNYYDKKINICPKCKNKNFVLIENNDNGINATIIDDNLCIERDLAKCIGCGMCKNTCKLRENLKDNKFFNNCVYCGCCIQTCPTGALMPKNDMPELLKNLKNKTCIALVAPAVRVTIGEEFNKKYGSFEEKKLVGILKKMGFDYVFDVTYGADLTTIEESYELIERIKNNKNLPLISSCCPSSVLYIEKYYPELIKNLSSCKSPILMLATIIRNYFVSKKHLDDVYIVAIVPCTSKKYEIKRKELMGYCNLAITTRELIDYIKDKYNYNTIEEASFDSIFNGSGSGYLFGNTGGVSESIIRCVYNILTDDDLNYFELNEVRGLDNVKETNIFIGDKEINIAVVNGMNNAKRILENIKKGKSKYEFIEIMNCYGGCIGGGGGPKLDMYEESLIKEKRMNSLYKKEKLKKIKTSYKNGAIIDLYKKYLGKPNGKKAIKLLHTTYSDKSSTIKKGD